LGHGIVIDDIDLIVGGPKHGDKVMVAVPQLDVTWGGRDEISTAPPIEVARQGHGQRPLLCGHACDKCEHVLKMTRRGDECVRV
jgi:hypothetical protein